MPVRRWRTGPSERPPVRLCPGTQDSVPTAHAMAHPDPIADPTAHAGAHGVASAPDDAVQAAAAGLTDRGSATPATPRTATPIVSTCELPPNGRMARPHMWSSLVYARLGGRPMHLDLAVPPGQGPFPLLVMLHGGAWRRGHGEDCDHYIADAAAAGFAAATVDYRLAEPGGEKWPVEISDARCAVRWLRAHADHYGLDPQRFAAVGFSSGGHLAALLATAPDASEMDGDCPLHTPSPRVQAAVAYFTPFDLRPGAPMDIFSDRAVTNFLGESRHDDPALAALASPLTHVDASDPPFLIIQGTADRVVDPRQATNMRNALAGAHVPVTLVKVPGAGHGFAFMSRKPEQRAAACTLLAFLHHTLARP